MKSHLPGCFEKVPFVSKNCACNMQLYTTPLVWLLEFNLRLPSSSTSTSTSTLTVTFNTDSLLFDRKLESVTEGLPREFLNLLNKLSKEDLVTVLDYMISLKSEINPSENYRGSVIKIVTKFIIYCRLSFNIYLLTLVLKVSAKWRIDFSASKVTDKAWA